MADRGYIPSSPACGQWETLLAEALDGQLRPEDAAMFHEHMAACPACSALFEEARRGREWLEFLSPEPEVPEGLLDKILAQTGPGQVAGFGLLAEGASVAAMPQPWQRPGFTAHVRRYAEPRLMMTVAMAFFSIALTLNLTGVKLSSLRLSDLRPGAIRAAMTRRIVTASIPIIRYYDHLRFMYEVESSMRQMRSNPGEGENQQPSQTQPANPGESKGNAGGKNGGSHVEPPQHRGSSDVSPADAASGDYLETSFILKDRTSTPAAHTSHRWSQPAHSGGSVRRVGERSMIWIA
jgi:Putative zinc-finger